MSASRAVAPIASKRRRASAESLGDVSRAVSLCTAITERWWATMSWSSRAMRARSSIAVCSRSLTAIASCVAPSAATISVRRRVDSPTITAAATSRKGTTLPRRALAAVEREIALRRNGSVRTAPKTRPRRDDEIADAVERHAERGQGQRRLGRREDDEDEERRPRRGEEREPRHGEERRHRQDVQEDGKRRVALLAERELLVPVGRVEARLQRRDDGEDERQGDASVAAGEQAPGDDDRALAVSGELHAGIVAPPGGPRLARGCDLRSPPRG